MNLFIYDTEICNGVITPDNPPKVGYRYAEGWHDFTGMGVAVIAGFDVKEARYRVFLEDNFSDFVALLAERDAVMGFNNWRFDDKLLAANGVASPEYWTHPTSYDLAALIWRAAGIPNGEHPKGLGLDAICKANKLPPKDGHGADAPQLWQDGRVGRVIDYCLNDVRCTLQLYRHIHRAGGCVDPRTGDWLNVVVPR